MTMLQFRQHFICSRVTKTVTCQSSFHSTASLIRTYRSHINNHTIHKSYVVFSLWVKKFINWSFFHQIIRMTRIYESWWKISRSLQVSSFFDNFWILLWAWVMLVKVVQCEFLSEHEGWAVIIKMMSFILKITNYLTIQCLLQCCAF
jgi:hypothetical protein